MAFDDLTKEQKERLSKFYKRAVKTICNEDGHKFKPYWKEEKGVWKTCLNSIMVEFHLRPFDDFNLKGYMVYGKIGRNSNFTETFQFFCSELEYKSNKHISGAEKILLDFIMNH